MCWPGIIQAHRRRVNRATRADQPHDFREISHVPDTWLVHSQKNHSLAYNFAGLFLWQAQQNKCRLLFLNEYMICIKIIQFDPVAFAEAVRKSQIVVAHNVIHRKCAQLLWVSGTVGQLKRVVRNASLR